MNINDPRFSIRSLTVGLMLTMPFCTTKVQQASAEVTGQPGVVSAEFIYETAPIPSCHASTIVETPAGLVAAWFGGTQGRRQLERTAGRRQRSSAQSSALSVLESGALPSGRRAVVAVLQMRSQPYWLVGDVDFFHRSWALLVVPTSPSRNDSWTGPKQADSVVRRGVIVRFQHRARWLARPF